MESHHSERVPAPRADLERDETPGPGLPPRPGFEESGMNPETPNVVVPLPRRAAGARRSGSRPYGLPVDGEVLLREMRRLGLTGAALAKRAGVSPATASHAIHGRRLHPDKLAAIRTALDDVKPLPGLDELVKPLVQGARP